MAQITAKNLTLGYRRKKVIQGVIIIIAVALTIERNRKAIAK